MKPIQTILADEKSAAENPEHWARSKRGAPPTSGSLSLRATVETPAGPPSPAGLLAILASHGIHGAQFTIGRGAWKGESVGTLTVEVVQPTGADQAPFLAAVAELLSRLGEVSAMVTRTSVEAFGLTREGLVVSDYVPDPEVEDAANLENPELLREYPSPFPEDPGATPAPYPVPDPHAPDPMDPDPHLAADAREPERAEVDLDPPGKVADLMAREADEGLRAVESEPLPTIGPIGPLVARVLGSRSKEPGGNP